MKRFKTVTISSPDQSTMATFVPERGGTLSSIIMLGKSGPRELLYLHDFFWDENIDDLPGGSPFCFPVCARLERQGQRGAYLYDGHIYTLPIHGFAWSEPWQVQQLSAHHIVLQLQDNEKTRQMFPFRFHLQLDYQISSGLLICHQTYTNRDSKPMPYYAGFHPYFLMPPPNQGKEQVMLSYHPIRRLRYNNSFTDIIGEQALFKLPTAITNPEINEQLTMVSAQKNLLLTFPNGDQLQMIAEGVEDPNLFPYVQLYTMNEKPFFCMEPWMGFPNAMNSVQGVRWLPPSSSEHGVMKLQLN